MDASTLREAMGASLSAARYAQLTPAFNAALVQAGCVTVNRAAMWCAQLGHESSGLRYMEEIASGQAYEGRRDLGNTQPGDGRRFKGHGPIQITGRANHLAVSKWAHGKGYVPTPTYFVDHPTELGSDRYGFLGPVWYWTVARSKINGMCDRGDLVGVTKAINGGTNGLADRQRRWDVCRRLGNRLLPTTASVPGGIETMAFGDIFTDWAGNRQSVKGWMDHVDQRLAGLSAALLSPAITSRVDGKRYDAPTFLSATHGDVNAAGKALEDKLDALEDKLDRLLAALPAQPPQ